MSSFERDEASYVDWMAESISGQSNRIQEKVEWWAKGKLSQNRTAGFFSENNNIKILLNNTEEI